MTRVGVPRPRRDRRRKRSALVLGFVAAGHAAVLPQRVQAERRLARASCRIRRSSSGWLKSSVPRRCSAVPNVRRGRGRARQVRRLGLHVDVAGGGAAADVRAGRPHEDLDLFEVVDVARHQPVVAHVVDEQAVGGIEAAHVEHVAGGARRAAAFAGLQRDAGHVAQRFAQRGHALRFHRGAGNHFDRLRNVAQRRLVSRRLDDRGARGR